MTIEKQLELIKTALMNAESKCKDKESNYVEFLKRQEERKLCGPFSYKSSSEEG